uniref:SUMO-conjugating enzyme SCE1 n=1 Tax=Rhizophora mucronata TaxID=61149 RepID=A0A2P2MPA3_RHIMU
MGICGNGYIDIVFLLIYIDFNGGREMMIDVRLPTTDFKLWLLAVTFLLIEFTED